MKTEKIFWTDYSILICTKCQKSIPVTPDLNGEVPNFAESIKTRFKAEFNDLGYKGKVRVMTTSCLGVCPTGFQAVSLVSTNDLGKSLSYVFDPVAETDSILEQLKNSVQT